MKKLIFLIGLIAALVWVNDRYEETHECQCDDDCWCKQPGLSLFRWVFPFRHSLQG